MLLDDLASCVDASCSESLISRQFHLRLQPELGFTAGMLHMDVWARFFAREEVEPVPANTEDSGTHVSRISDSLGRSTSGRTQRSPATGVGPANAGHRVQRVVRRRCDRHPILHRRNWHEGILLLEGDVPPSRRGRDHRAGRECAKSCVALVLGKLRNIAGDELRKVPHGDVEHAAIDRGDLDQPQQRLGVGFCDPHTRNRLAEKVGCYHSLGEAGASKGVDVLDGPPGVGSAGFLDRFPYGAVDAPRARRSPEQRAVDSDTLNSPVRGRAPPVRTGQPQQRRWRNPTEQGRGATRNPRLHTNQTGRRRQDRDLQTAPCRSSSSLPCRRTHGSAAAASAATRGRLQPEVRRINHRTAIRSPPLSKRG